jgi:hypothetical protein
MRLRAPLVKMVEVEGTGSVQGEFVETVCAIPGAHCKIVMLRPPDGGSRLELSYESSVRMAYVRGPEGIIVSLFERIA